MKIKVLLFAKLREIVGKESVDLELPERTTALGALEALFEDKKQVEQMREYLLFAINQSYARPDAILKEADELALIPPMAGG